MQIKFKSNDANIQSSEKQVVSNLNSVVSSFSNSRIFILGHTDSIGPEDLNQELSEARAESIHKNLVNQSFTNSEVLVRGMGEMAPIADNSTSLGRSKNRRVVVVLTGLDAGKVALLKERLANTQGMTVLEKESSIVNEFVAAESYASQATSSTGELEASSNQAGEATTVVEVPPETKTNYRYSVAAGAYYNFLEAEDRDNSNAQAQWVSELNVPFGGYFQFSLSKFWLGVKLFGHLQDYKIEKSSSYIWDEENPLLIRGSLISDYETERFGFGFDVDFNEEVFIYESLGNVRLEKDLFIGVSARAKYKWLASEHWSSRIGGVVSYPLLVSSDIGSEGELGYILELDLRRENVLKNHGLTTKLYYGFRNFSNEQNDQKETVLGLMLSVDSLLWL